MARGVVAGTNTPNQKLYSECGNPASVVVGTSGKSGDRSELLTASAMSLPSRISGRGGQSGLKKKSPRPVMTSVSPAGDPLYGIGSALKSAARRNLSEFSCAALPSPIVT